MSIEPFGYFRANPFGWEDCAETESDAVPLYERSSIDKLEYQLSAARREADSRLAERDGYKIQLAHVRDELETRQQQFDGAIGQRDAARHEAAEAKGLNASVDKLINDVIQLLTMRGDWAKAVEMLLNRPRCDQHVSALGAAIEQARREEREKFIAQLGDLADNARDNGYPLAVEALQEAIEQLAETPCDSATRETGDAIDTAIAAFWKGGA